MRVSVVLPSILLFACVPAEEPQGGAGGYTTDLPDTPGMALLQSLLTEHFEAAGRNVPTTCATIYDGGEEPSALPEEVETALIERFEDLAPYARCKWSEGQVVDADTGEGAIIYQVHGIECSEPRDCLAMGGFVIGNLGAEYEQYRVRRVSGDWTFEKTGVAIAS